jgi:hypothetical protein
MSVSGATALVAPDLQGREIDEASGELEPVRRRRRRSPRAALHRDDPRPDAAAAR